LYKVSFFFRNGEFVLNGIGYNTLITLYGKGFAAVTATSMCFLLWKDMFDDDELCSILLSSQGFDLSFATSSILFIISSIFIIS